MGLFNKAPKESDEEIRARISNNPVARTIANHFVSSFYEDGEYLNWLKANYKRRAIQFKCYKTGVLIEFLDFSIRTKDNNGTYVVNKQAISFNGLGAEDLPNNGYVTFLSKYLNDAINENCPLVKNNGSFLKLADNVMKGW